MKTKKKTKWELFRKQGALQVFVWMGMIYLIIFNLIPMFGIIMGFKRLFHYQRSERNLYKPLGRNKMVQGICDGLQIRNLGEKYRDAQCVEADLHIPAADSVCSDDQRDSQLSF